MLEKQEERYMKGKLKVIPHLSMEVELWGTLGKHAALDSITIKVKKKSHNPK